MDPFAGKRLNEITSEDIRQLIEDRVPESLYLDYKRELELNTDNQKKEFLKDVTSFANSQGGLILCGVDEKRDEKNKTTGIPCALPGISVSGKDDLILRIEHILKNGVDERLPRPEIETIDLENGKSVLALRVQASLRAPHMVVYNDDLRFYVRANRGKQDMSTAQIREVVLRSNAIEERIRRFVTERVDIIRASYSDRPTWLLHIVPLLRKANVIDVTDPDVTTRLEKLESPSGGQARHCLEGFKVFRIGEDGGVDQALVFRDGSMEFVDQTLFPPAGQERYFNYKKFHERIARCLEGGLLFYRDTNTWAPSAVCLTIQNIAGFRFTDLGAALYASCADSITAPMGLIAPDPVIVDDPMKDPQQILRPLLDVVWNTFGMPRCLGYDEDGNFKGYKRFL